MNGVTKLVTMGMLLGMATGCGGGAGRPLAPGAQPASQPWGASASVASVDEASRESAPEARQGLGTQWGETRNSRSVETDFERASPRQPVWVGSLHYNDRRGIEAAIGAQRELRHGDALAGPEVAVSLRQDGGDRLPTRWSGGHGYVIGAVGQRYEIVLTNHGGRRLEVVTTVDGIDVINGRSGSLGHRGYVLEPYTELIIDGFRQSEGTVAAFRFGAVDESYAAAQGGERHVGVIGVAVFDERLDPVRAEELRLRSTASPFPASDSRFAAPPSR